VRGGVRNQRGLRVRGGKRSRCGSSSSTSPNKRTAGKTLIACGVVLFPLENFTDHTVPDPPGSKIICLSGARSGTRLLGNFLYY
jgi:hypothetical protein